MPHAAAGHRPGLVALALAVVMLGTGMTATRGASPPPPGDPSPGSAGTVNLTGHWAVAGTGGFDITQHGSRIDGTSVAGIRLSGTLSGRAATFRFWSGDSFAGADPEDRGIGSFRASPDGRTMFVSWQNEEPSDASLDPVFTAVRVVDIVEGPSPPPSGTWFTAANFQLAQWLALAVEAPLETVIGYLIVVSHPTPAQLHEDVAAYEAMLYLFLDWDRDHGIKPRPEP